MNALLKPVNAIKVLFLLLFLSTSFFVASCKKDDGEKITPRTELQNKIKGKWNVNSIDEKYYSNNVLDSAESAFKEFETGELTIEFIDGGFIATQQGYQPETYDLVEQEDGTSFTYAEGQAKAVITLNENTMTWVETYTATSNGVQLKLIRTFLLTKL